MNHPLFEQVPYVGSQVKLPLEKLATHQINALLKVVPHYAPVLKAELRNRGVFV